MTRREALAGVTLGAICLALGPARAAESFGFADLMATLASVREASAEFDEERRMSVLAEPLRLEGRLFYRAPGYLEKRILRPREETLIVTATHIIAQSATGRSEIVLADQPLLQAAIGGLRALMSGDGAMLERLFRQRLDGDKGAWRLRLEPIDARIAAVLQALEVTGHGPQIDRLEVIETNGDLSLTRIRALP